MLVFGINNKFMAFMLFYLLNMQHIRNYQVFI